MLLQVSVNILEARKLVGVNINPAVFIRVGNQKKNTQTQKSTNCPFYNEVQHSLSQYAVAYRTVHWCKTLTNLCYLLHRRTFSLSFRSIRRSSSIKSSKLRSISLFVFSLLYLHFHCLRKRSNVSSTPTQVFHRRSLPFLMSHIGTFKIDISTVYKQPGANTALTALFKNTVQHFWPPPLHLQTTASSRSGLLSLTQQTPDQDSKGLSRPLWLCWWRGTHLVCPACPPPPHPDPAMTLKSQ